MLLSIGDWFAQNWAILVLILLAIAFLVPTYLRQRKESKERSELIDTIKKGTKVLTTFGVYGVVDSIEDTSDGKVVTMITGDGKNDTTMKVHINAIGGIDNKTPVVIDEDGARVEPKKVEDVKEEVKEEVVEEIEEDNSTEEIEEKESKKSTKKN